MFSYYYNDSTKQTFNNLSLTERMGSLNEVKAKFCLTLSPYTSTSSREFHIGKTLPYQTKSFKSDVKISLFISVKVFVTFNYSHANGLRAIKTEIQVLSF